MNLGKVAIVLERAADYIDAVEQEKRANVESARKARVDQVASAHASAHGESIPESMRGKLASTDPEVLAFLETVLKKQADVIEPLGGPAPSSVTPPTTKEAADAADERFVSWIVSH